MGKIITARNYREERNKPKKGPRQFVRVNRLNCLEKEEAFAIVPMFFGNNEFEEKHRGASRKYQGRIWGVDVSLEYNPKPGWRLYPGSKLKSKNVLNRLEKVRGGIVKIILDRPNHD